MRLFYWSLYILREPQKFGTIFLLVLTLLSKFLWSSLENLNFKTTETVILKIKLIEAFLSKWRNSNIINVSQCKWTLWQNLFNFKRPILNLKSKPNLILWCTSITPLTVGGIIKSYQNAQFCNFCRANSNSKKHKMVRLFIHFENVFETWNTPVRNKLLCQLLGGLR